MTELSLNDIINEALTELDPYADTPAESQDEDEVDLSLTEEDGAPDSLETTGEESDIEEDESEDDESEDESEDGEEEVSDDDADADLYNVKVDGEELQVSLDELKAGYSRQSHFTRSMQALKEEKEAFETEIGEYNDTFEQLQSLDAAWESNPVSVMTSLLGSTENPSYMLGLLIKEAAASDMLTAEALQYFGIDDATKQAWTTETEMERLRREIADRETQDNDYATKAEEQAAEARIQEAINLFENQVTDIIASENLDLPTSTERAQFKAELLRYAQENQILDLNKAYAAMSYEAQREGRQVAARRAANHQKKSATKVVSRTGAGESGVSSVTSTTDLRSVIEKTMKELKF